MSEQVKWKYNYDENITAMKSNNNIENIITKKRKEIEK